MVVYKWILLGVVIWISIGVGLNFVIQQNMNQGNRDEIIKNRDVTISQTEELLKKISLYTDQIQDETRTNRRQVSKSAETVVRAFQDFTQEQRKIMDQQNQKLDQLIKEIKK